MRLKLPLINEIRFPVKYVTDLFCWINFSIYASDTSKYSAVSAIVKYMFVHHPFVSSNKLYHDLLKKRMHPILFYGDHSSPSK